MTESISAATALSPATTVRVLRGERTFPAQERVSPAAQAGGTGEPSRKSIQEAVSRIENFISRYARKLEFSVDEASGRTVVTVREKGTGKVVRQIPPEEVLAVAADIAEQRTAEDSSGALLRART